MDDIWVVRQLKMICINVQTAPSSSILYNLISFYYGSGLKTYFGLHWYNKDHVFKTNAKRSIFIVPRF